MQRIKKTLIALAALAALAVGGSAIAHAGSDAESAPAASSQEAEGPETGKDNDDIQFEDQNGKDDASEKGESGEAESAEDVPEKGESGEAESEKGESAKDDDGPGGHADEPGNADAEHEFDGNE